MMSACSMPRVNTGHGVRATQRTNALIRPIGMASVVTRQPYRSAGTRKGRLWDGRVGSQHYCYLR